MAAQHNRLVERADRLIDLRRWEPAEELLHRVLAADPEHFGALNSLSYLYYMVDDYDRSAELARRMVAVAPDSDIPYHRLGEALRLQGKLTDAESAAREALTRDPDDPGNLEALAEVLRMQRGRGTECEELLREAARIAPHRAAPLGGLARLFRSGYRWPEAVAAATEAVARDPQDPGWHVLLGEILLRAKRPADAVDALTTALRLDPAAVDLDHVLRRLVEHDATAGAAEGLYRTLCVALGRPDLTLPGSAGTDPALRDAQLAVVDSLIDGAQLDPAAAILAELRAADPTHPGTRRMRAVLLEAQDRSDEAVAELRALMADGDDGKDTMTLLARVVVDTEDHEAAVAIGRSGAGRFPDVVAFRVAESSGLLGLGRIEEALHAARAAVELAPYSTAAHRVLAGVLREGGDPDGAEAALREAVARYPEEVLHWFNLGLHQLLRGESEAAIDTLSHADEMSPDTLNARVMLGTAWLVAGEFTAAVAAISEAVVECDGDLLPTVIGILESCGIPEPLAPSYALACQRLGRAPRRPDDDPALLIGRVHFGMIMSHMGHRDLAEVELDSVLTLVPDHAGALAALSELRRRQRRFAEAVEHGQRSLAVDPDGEMAVVALSALAFALPKVGRPDEALERARYGCHKYPDEGDFPSAIGEVLLARGELSAALDSARRACEVSPSWGYHRIQAGRALLMMGDPETALVELRRGHEMGDDRAESACWLGIGLALAGDTDGAAAMLAEAKSGPDPVDPVDLAGQLASSGLAARAPGFAEWLGVPVVPA